jgi:hypothetical protein
MLVPWPATKYTIRGKVVASPKFKLWWILWVWICPWLVLTPKVLQLCINQLVVWFMQVHVSDWSLVILPSPMSELQHALLPLKCYELGSVPQLLIFPLFSLQIHIWVYQRVWEHVLCHLMLKATDFSWLWNSSVYFAYWFFVFLNYCYFFFFFYYCTTTTIGTIITITSNSVSKGEGDALPSHGVKPTWGFHKVKLRKLWLSGTLPASNSKKGVEGRVGSPGIRLGRGTNLARVNLHPKTNQKGLV